MGGEAINNSPDSLLRLQTRRDDAQLHQRRPVPASPEAEEHLGGAEAAVSEVGWEAGGRAVQQLVIVMDILPEAGEDDSHVSDGVLVVAGLEVDLQGGLLEPVLGPGGREATHYKVVSPPPLLTWPLVPHVVTSVSLYFRITLIAIFTPQS